MEKIVYRAIFLAALCCSFQLGANGLAEAREFRVVFDGRETVQPAKASADELALLSREVLPVAERHWKGEGKECEREFRVVDTAQGSFTRRGSKQKAFLYSYCVTGHNFGLDGIAVVEEGTVVAHIAYQGAWDMGLKALPDVNRNGLSEVMIVTGGINMGDLWQSVAVIEIDGRAVKKLGGTQTYDDDCKEEGGAGPANAYRILASPGTSPSFKRETYQRACDGKKWKRTEISPLTLDEDEVEYEMIK
jgi:hypothetical protein